MNTEQVAAMLDLAASLTDEAFSWTREDDVWILTEEKEHIPMDLTEAQQAQIAMRDKLVRTAIFSADTYAMRAREAGRTPADTTRIAVSAAIGLLIAQGLISITPEDQWPEWLQCDVPDYLVPTMGESGTLIKIKLEDS